MTSIFYSLLTLTTVCAFYGIAVAVWGFWGWLFLPLIAIVYVWVRIAIDREIAIARQRR